MIKTLCDMCPIGCGIEVHAVDGRAIRISHIERHPFRLLCVKARAILDWVYARERVTTPLIKQGNSWREISWDEAENIIAEKLKDIKAKYGAKALVVHLGDPVTGTHLDYVAKRFCSLYDTPNYTSNSSFCLAAKIMGHSLTFNYDGAALFPNYRDTQCILLWGSNPPHSGLLIASAILARREKGARLIVIDPRRTSLAKKADIHARIKPGTDCALALSLLNVIITEKLYDKDFVEKWTVGFDRLSEHIKEYTPEKVQKITWVPAKTIREIARMYATTKPACIASGVSLEHSSHGVQASRAIAMLMGITGNIDVPGGNTYAPPLGLSDLRVKSVAWEEALGAGYPLFHRFADETTAMPAADAILYGKPYPVKAMIVQGANPAAIWPNSAKVHKALASLELLVVATPFMSETAQQAHLVLPASTFLERKVLKEYSNVGLPFIAWGDRAIEPMGDSLPDWKIWAELARKLGFGEYFPWADEDEIFADLLHPTPLTLEQLKEKPEGIFYRPRARQRYLQEGFHTPSGKLELYSETLASSGYDPMPVYRQ